MADDASGTDGDDDGHEEASPTESDVQSADDERGQREDSWGRTDRDGQMDRDDRAAHDDRADRDGRIRATDTENVAHDENHDDGYRIPLDLSGADDETDDADTDDSYAPEPSSTPIEPGDPALENVLFVFLGAVVMILVIFRTISIPF
ncbi:DUF7312 domain-containing protein [Natronorubrum halophilum]|uniref:DUF7312 domain-containing protein n=1 Tax=Natronorubrum halophilum TaxID=1702106 RepID=UPI000EF64B2E|nr:hypothetical protein [Natronorubrum halophilum]